MFPRHGALTMTRGLNADAEQRDPTRAPRNRDPRQAEAGPLVKSCPGPARAPAAADVHDGPVTMYARRPRGHARLPDLGDQRLEPQASRLRRRTTGYASSHHCRALCGLRSADTQGTGRGSRGMQRPGCDWQAAVARQKADGQPCAVRAGRPGLCQRHRGCVRPQIPGLSPGGLGPHLPSSGSPRGLSSGFPFARRVLPLPPPSSGFPSSGVLRFVPFGRGPVPIPRRFPCGVPFP